MVVRGLRLIEQRRRRNQKPYGGNLIFIPRRHSPTQIEAVIDQHRHHNIPGNVISYYEEEL